MREIEFRGEHTHTNEFKYGYFVYNKEKDEYKIDTGVGLAWFVKPETVGQYTGRKDKNGTKIFEGDLLYYCNSDHDDENGAMKVIFENSAFAIVGDIFVFLNETYSWELEVVGNIYDNPELLIDDGQEEN